MRFPAYSDLRPVTPSAGVVLCPNPGYMTFEGTNCWVLRAPGSDRCIVVDPGPEDEGHLTVLSTKSPGVALVLITHRHSDHTEGIDRFRQLTGAPVRAALPEHCRDAAPLVDGERIELDGLVVDVMATPGHTADSLCFLVDIESADDAGARRAVVTGDTVLGKHTPVLDSHDGDLRAYLETLAKLEALGEGVTGLTAHGPDVPDLQELVRKYSAHRRDRLEQVRAARAELGPDATVRQIVETVYTDVDPVLMHAAEQSTAVALAYLDSEEG